MGSNLQITHVPKKLFVTGWILTVLSALMLTLSAALKFVKPPDLVKGFADLGLNANLAFGLGVLELACTILYLIPRTAVLGAILLTGYLGGAVLTNLRVGNQFFAPVILGVVLWGGLFLRDPRLRALIPIRS